MERPILSPQFTIEDIHKLREYNYYLTKDMTPQQRMDFYNNAAMAFERELYGTEGSDYTKWQREYFDAKTPEEISGEASEYEKNHSFTGKAERI